MAPCITLSERQVLGFTIELIGPRPFDGRRTQLGAIPSCSPVRSPHAYGVYVGLAGPARNTRDATIEMKPQPQTSSQEVLAGLIERVTYHNAENGFCVLRAKARGPRDVVTVVGHAAAIAAGEWITASGEWVNDRTHGQQFKARFLRTSPPTSADGIEKYLSSGMIRGVGPVYAKFLPDKRTSFLPNRHCCN